MCVRAFLAIVLGALLWIGVGSPALAQYYVSGSLGFQQEVDKTVSTDIAPVNFSFNPGVAANVAVGYRFPWNFRVEVEGGYLQTSLKSGSALGVTLTTTGNINIYTGMVNAFYDVPTDTILLPYIGAGLGFASEQGGNATVAGVNAGGLGSATNLAA